MIYMKKQVKIILYINHQNKNGHKKKKNKINYIFTT